MPMESALQPPQKIQFASLAPVSHDLGVIDRETHIQGVRWAVVEYSEGSGRADWCENPHVCLVLAGSLRYDFEDSRESIVVNPGEALILPPSPRHRGQNIGTGSARLFLIDQIPKGLETAKSA